MAAPPHTRSLWASPTSRTMMYYGCWEQRTGRRRFDTNSRRPIRLGSPASDSRTKRWRPGGTQPAVLSAANEVAVEAFVAGRIAFGRIPEVIEGAMHRVPARRTEPRRGKKSRWRGPQSRRRDRRSHRKAQSLNLLAVVTFVGFEKVVTFLVMLSVLIVLHELGHFVLARRNGVRVNEFAIGFGPRLLGWTSPRSGTLYSLRALPIGGFCAMEGEDNRVSEAQQQREFPRRGARSPRATSRRSPPWRRLAIIARRTARKLSALLLDPLDRSASVRRRERQSDRRLSEKYFQGRRRRLPDFVRAIASSQSTT